MSIKEICRENIKHFKAEQERERLAGIAELDKARAELILAARSLAFEKVFSPDSRRCRGKWKRLVACTRKLGRIEKKLWVLTLH